MLRTRAKEGIQSKKGKKQDAGAWFDESKYPPLANPEEPIPLNVDDSSFPATNPSAVTFNTTPFDEHLVRTVALQPGQAVG